MQIDAMPRLPPVRFRLVARQRRLGQKAEQREAHSGRCVAQLRKAAVAMQAKPAKLRAAGDLAAPAPMACAAEDDRVDRDPLARLGFGDAVANRHNAAGELVAENDRRAGPGDRVRRVDRNEGRAAQPLLDVGAADTAPAHPQLHLTWPGRRRRWHLIDPDGASGMPADRKHVTPPSDLRYQSQVTWSQDASG